VEKLTSRNVVERREQYFKNRWDCSLNISRMREMITLREEEARVLGYQNRAKFKADIQMGKCATCIDQLIHGLRETVIKSAPTRLNELLRLKEQNVPGSRTLCASDYAFCSHESNAVDWKQLSEYFELKRTLRETILTFSKLFGLKFKRIQVKNTNPFQDRGKGEHGYCKVWNDEVKVYSVWNHFNDEKDFLGYLYLDLLSRENKANVPGHIAFQAVGGFLSSSVILIID
jgi:Zn-dependent oligopeptidase